MEAKSERAAPLARGNGSRIAHQGDGQFSFKAMLGRTQDGIAIFHDGSLVGFVVKCRSHGFDALDRFAQKLGRFNSPAAAASALLMEAR